MYLGSFLCKVSEKNWGSFLKKLESSSSMTYELIIAEKPSAAAKIAQALADGKPVKKSEGTVSYFMISHAKKDIIVAAAAGHLYGVAQIGERTYDYPVYEMEWKPNADISKEAAFSKKYITVLKKLAKGASSFTVATDYDIEGETIGYNVIRFAAKEKDASRMKFSTLTKEDLVAAYTGKEPHIDWGQANAGETRHFLDWLYGINLSRALTMSVKAAGSFKVLSIGRVQGPSLHMLVEKEREIAKFVAEPYWQVELHATKEKEELIGLHKADKFWKKEEATAIHTKVQKEKHCTVKKKEARETKQQPPFPFDLGTLQTEAYRCFKIRPKETLETAQRLYSDGYISYPRTSSQQLDPKLGFKKILAALEKQEHYTALAKQVLGTSLKPNNGKKSDPAHPAIYPTGTQPNVSERDLKVYDLIVKRFFATFGESAKRETVTLRLDAASEEFIAKGTRTTFKGWHELYAPYVRLEEEELPHVFEGDSLVVKSCELLEKETQPPKRYTQASIITELEKRNLGTKATRADVIEALYKRNYVKGDNSIEVTELGMQMITILEKRVPEIIDEELTRHFEEELNEIRANTKAGKDVLEEAKIPLGKTLDKFKKDDKIIGGELILAYRSEQDAMSTLGSCPKCTEGQVKVMYSKKNKKRFLGCSAYPDCDNTYPLPQKGVITPTEKTCEHCAVPLMKIKAGKRLQEVCPNPACKSKEAEEELEKRICPKCKKELVLRKSVYGAFYGCSGYPKCRHTEKIKEK